MCVSGYNIPVFPPVSTLHGCPPFWCGLRNDVTWPRPDHTHPPGIGYIPGGNTDILFQHGGNAPLSALVASAPLIKVGGSGGIFTVVIRLATLPLWMWGHSAVATDVYARKRIPCYCALDLWEIMCPWEILSYLQEGLACDTKTTVFTRLNTAAFIFFKWLEGLGMGLFEGSIDQTRLWNNLELAV